jgi:hypothetical protein
MMAKFETTLCVETHAMEVMKRKEFFDESIPDR